MEKGSDIIKSKDIVQKLSSGSPVILLRHAESKHNEATKINKTKEYVREERARERSNKDYRDGPITKNGVKQCEETSKITDELNVETVLISPLRRALETAYNVFKKHPNFDISEIKY